MGKWINGSYLDCEGSYHLHRIKFWTSCAPGNGGLGRGENFWLRLAIASAQCLRLSGRYFHYNWISNYNWPTCDLHPAWPDPIHGWLDPYWNSEWHQLVLQTLLKETPLHVALRLQNVEAVKLLLESSSLDVVCCDTFQRLKVCRPI